MALSQLPTANSPAVLSDNNTRSYVDWGAILAGVAVYSGLISVLAAFTSAIGLSIVAVTNENRVAGFAFLIAAALWALWIQLSSAMAGAYITGRMRHRIGDAKQSEVEMRDGMHGLIMWAVSVVLSALVAGSIALAAGSAMGKFGVDDSTAYFSERLLRPMPATDAAGADASAIVAPVLDQNVIDRAGLLLARIVMVPNDADQAYLVTQVASSAGIPTAEAATRVEQTTAEIKLAADNTRRFGVIMAFFTAVSLLLGAVGAWWAVCKGGEHRDQGIDHSQFMRFG